MSTSSNAVFDCSMELLLEVAPRMCAFLAAVIIAGLGYNESTSSPDIPYGDPYGTGNQSEVPRKYSFEVVNYLLFAGLVMSNALPLFGYLFKLLPPNRIRWHAEHIAHRYAEWVMMVLGESVLSAILAPVHNRSLYYLSFWAALLIAQTLQFVHYSSEEFDMNKHALGRKLRAGRLWMALMTVYSVALIGFGTGVKALLYSVVCDSSSYRMLAASSSYSSGDDDEPGKVSDDDGTSSYCESAPSNYALLVCLSHVAQYLAQQVSLPLHEGAAEYIWHFFNYSQRSVYYIIGSKCATILAMLVLAFTDHQLKSHALLLAILAITMVQGLTQTIENMIMHVRKQDKIDTKTDKTVIKRSSSSFYRFYNETAGSVVPKSWIKMFSTRSPQNADSQAKTKASKELKCIPTQQEDFISKSPIDKAPEPVYQSEPHCSI
jgi:hypothetical protein